MIAVAFGHAQAQAPKSSWAKFDGGKIHYYDVGKRADRALILIHGWTCNANFWKDSYSTFPEYRVIALDLPGHGRSNQPHTKYSMEYFAHSIDAVMRAAKAKPTPTLTYVISLTQTWPAPVGTKFLIMPVIRLSCIAKQSAKHLQACCSAPLLHYRRYLWVMGRRRPMPIAFREMIRVGGSCLRLNSFEGCSTLLRML